MFIEKFTRLVHKHLNTPSFRLFTLLTNDPLQKAVIREIRHGIWKSDVVNWEKFGCEGRLWGTKGQLLSWLYDPVNMCWCELNQVNDHLSALVISEEQDNWECDLREVQGFAASKDMYDPFSNLKAFVELMAPGLLTPVTPEKLKENLAHAERRILQDNEPHSFSRWTWDGRVFIENIDGSHHLAAAIVQAEQLNVPVRLNGRLRTYRLNPAALACLRRDFDMYVVSSEPKQANALHTAIKDYKAPYSEVPLPFPYTKQRALMLPKENNRSVKISNILSGAGFQDLAVYLDNLARPSDC
ncbi:DUF6685 family protein [Pseudomonas batumici]|uniref:DUF6685 family protein n=1 Tax=Pseudomonas batumici TaxID=226910 RepID=UPI0030D1B58D